jgi:hypothetical protein
MKSTIEISKFFVLFSLFFIFFNAKAQKMNSNPEPFKKITNQFSVEDFEQVKTFILEKGIRKTYRNYDNNNPFYDFGKFQGYLAADIGQQNINNDSQLSDFNELTLKDANQYYKILIVRKGDTKASKKGILKGMQEGEVYFIAVFETVKNSNILFEYLKIMKEVK